MKRIVLTGGGTAGHIAPNLALLPALRRDGWEIHYIGAKDSLEEKLISQEQDVTFHSVQVGKLRRYRSIRNLSDPFRVVAGTFQAAHLLRKLKPLVVFAKGGFVSVPVVAGARLAGVPSVLHESDFSPGLANRMCIPLSRHICTAFPETAKTLGDKAVYTGLPVRPALLAGDAKRGLFMCGFSGKRPVLLMMGGSQGAAAINQALRAALDKITDRFDVVHLCGEGNLDPTLANRRGYFQMAYATDELADLFAITDVVLSRAGAGAIFEFLALQVPALLIPLPTNASRGDQIENAKYFSDKGFLAMLPQAEMTPETLTQAIFDVYARRSAYSLRIKQADMSGATERVLRVIYDAAKPERK